MSSQNPEKPSDRPKKPRKPSPGEVDSEQPTTGSDAVGEVDTPTDVQTTEQQVIAEGRREEKQADPQRTNDSAPAKSPSEPVSEKMRFRRSRRV